MFTSTADVFRRRQALRDLINVLNAQPEAVSRLGRTQADRAAIGGIIASGGILTGPDAERLSSQLLLTASLPDDDFHAFTAATALLVINRLSGGPGDDDLFWNWDAFSAHYRLADPPVRAAIMTGFCVMEQAGPVWLEGGPGMEDCLSLSRKTILEAMDDDDPTDLRLAIKTHGSPEDAGRLWRETWGKPMSPVTLAGFRYLYERPLSMAPEMPSCAPLLPWP
ncbi:MAG: hypothetical protein OIF48_06875 [Silicimonas sp.]|nr:hypothetical protein [Silicimonas sp.]